MCENISCQILFVCNDFIGVILFVCEDFNGLMQITFHLSQSLHNIPYYLCICIYIKSYDEIHWFHIVSVFLVATCSILSLKEKPKKKKCDEGDPFWWSCCLLAHPFLQIFPQILEDNCCWDMYLAACVLFIFKKTFLWIFFKKMLICQIVMIFYWFIYWFALFLWLIWECELWHSIVLNKWMLLDSAFTLGTCSYFVSVKMLFWTSLYQKNLIW